MRIVCTVSVIGQLVLAGFVIGLLVGILIVA